jgi:FkbM family methyltransferase
MRLLGERSLATVARAVAGRQHWVALANMARVYPRFAPNLWRYVSGRGSYPYAIEVRTPLGVVRPTLHSVHDLRTVNEVFCRLDYRVDAAVRTVVDIGSNIGLSALYFLTRNAHARCYLHEPDPRNVPRLRANLAPFAGRWEIAEVAVGDRRGPVAFGIEPSGRYGGVERPTGETIQVRCIHITDALDAVLAREPWIDVLKLDTEGLEVATVRAIEPRHLARIGAIYLEATPDRPLHPQTFVQRQYGPVCRLTRRHPPGEPAGAPARAPG